MAKTGGELIQSWKGGNRTSAERLWRECGLPEYFLGNGGSNTKLDDFYKRAGAEAVAERDATIARLREALVQMGGPLEDMVDALCSCPSHAARDKAIDRLNTVRNIKHNALATADAKGGNG